MLKSFHSAMFHPDNIKNYTLDGVPVSISLNQYWQMIGGPQGLAKALNTNLKVLIFIESFKLFLERYRWI